jgi:hypothetical protein
MHPLHNISKSQAIKCCDILIIYLHRLQSFFITRL